MTAYATDADRRHEAEVAAALGRAWGCELRSFCGLAALDWWAVRDEALAGVAELKTRTHTTDRYATVFLSVRKWLALYLASLGLGVPAVFVVRFEDETRWCLIGLSMGAISIGGWRSPRRPIDVEPLIEVPVDSMRPLDEGAPF